jgi:hypothetical protein
MARRWIILVAAIAMLLSIGIVGAARRLLASQRAACLEKLPVGSTAAETVSRMGAPSKAYSAGDELPNIAPTKVHVGQVFVYDRGAIGVFFVYFDEEERISEVRWRPN